MFFDPEGNAVAGHEVTPAPQHYARNCHSFDERSESSDSRVIPKGGEHQRSKRVDGNNP
jgi:hypothetical protein